MPDKDLSPVVNQSPIVNQSPKVNLPLDKSSKSGFSKTGLAETKVPKPDLSEAHSSEIDSPNAPDSLKENVPSPRRTFLHNWRLWLLLTLVLSSGVCVGAVALLLRPSTAPNCKATFWPLASASTRLYCAQSAVDERTVEGVLRAIALVNSLPKDHGLRPEIDRHLKEWALLLVDLAEETFQAGELKRAIEVVHQVPDGTLTPQEIQERVKEWRAIWKEGEDIYTAVEARLRDEDWNGAFRELVPLLWVDCRYWTTTRYEELTDKIFLTRQDGDRLNKARDIAEAGDLDSLLEALKLIRSIQPSSYLYGKSREEMGKIGQAMFEIAKARLAARDFEAALAIARQIPKEAKLKGEVEDFIDLAWPQSLAGQGTLDGLRSAIGHARSIKPSQSTYGKAQTLIAQWQQEIEALTRLDEARELASPLTEENLRKAIALASTVPQSNPRWKDVQAEIEGWHDQIEVFQDRPYLSQATQLARGGTVRDLRRAVWVASQIRRGRALYPNAQSQVRSWTERIQRVEDQPLLDQARERAWEGDYGGAIALANQIGPGRALHQSAQEEVQKWGDQIQSGQQLDQARGLVRAGSSPSSLVSAIRLADRVPSQSGLRSDADYLIRQWSRTILDMAQAQVGTDIEGAIAIAEQVPVGTVLYDEAQRQIRVWREWLQSVPEPETVPEVEVPETDPGAEESSGGSYY